MFKYLTAVGLFLLVHIAHGFTCSQALTVPLHESSENSLLSEALEAVSVPTSKTLDENSPEIKLMFAELMLKNRDALGRNYIPSSKISEISFRAARDRRSLPKWRTFYLDDFPLVTSIRTNGKAMFFGETYELNQQSEPRPIQMVFLDGNGEVRSIDQSELILNSISTENVKVSRVMSEEELRMWKNNNINDIYSLGHPGLNKRNDITPRTTFGLNNLPYSGYDPVLFQVPKSVLMELQSEGALIFNTYDTYISSTKDFPNEAKTPFGLEVEMVVLGNEARSRIQPYMAKPIFEPTTDEMPVPLQRTYHPSTFKPPRGLPASQRPTWIRAKELELYALEKTSAKRREIYDKVWNYKSIETRNRYLNQQLQIALSQNAEPVLIKHIQELLVRNNKGDFSF